MKATDLMIGDWVQNPLSWKAKVQSIQYTNNINDEWEWLLRIGINEENYVNHLSESEIEPIPLTPEILEKNGFMIARGPTSWKLKTERDDLIDIYGVREYHLSINIEDTHGSGKGYRWMLNNLVIRYVHELQHALKLCGIDKTIEL